MAERLGKPSELFQWRLQAALCLFPSRRFELCLPACLDDMPKFLPEKVLPDHDHDETDRDDVAHNHLHEQE